MDSVARTYRQLGAFLSQDAGDRSIAAFYNRAAVCDAKPANALRVGGLRCSIHLAFIAGFLYATIAAGQTTTDRDFRVETAAPKRVALLIGNSNYQHVPKLKNAGNDARGLAAVLDESGFDTRVLGDVTLEETEKEVDRFVAGLTPGSVALFFFAGHGVQLDRENYLIPVEFQYRDTTSIKYEAVSASQVLERMAGTRARLTLMLLDACRNDPPTSTRSLSPGLASMNAARGSFIAFATSPGSTADDNPNSQNGLFTGQLLEVIREPGLPLDEVFHQVRQRVYNLSGGRQLPWTSSSVIGDFSFFPSIVETEPGAPSVTPGTTSGEAQVDAEFLAWSIVKDSSDPSTLETFLAEFPNGRFATLAQKTLIDLRIGGFTGKSSVPASLSPSRPETPSLSFEQRSLLAAAQDALTKKSYSRATRSATELLNQVPNLGEAYRILMRASFAQRDYAKASLYGQEALSAGASLEFTLLHHHRFGEAHQSMLAIDPTGLRFGPLKSCTRPSLIIPFHEVLNANFFRGTEAGLLLNIFFPNPKKPDKHESLKFADSEARISNRKLVSGRYGETELRTIQEIILAARGRAAGIRHRP